MKIDLKRCGFLTLGELSLGDALTLDINTPVYYINATLINSERTCKNG